MPGLDLEGISRSVVKLRADVPEDAFTAGILGSQRTGNGVVINSDGLILTIGYLITEATDVWLTTPDGRELAGHPLAYDQVTGFGLVLPLEKADILPIPLGSSAQLKAGDPAHVVSSAEFADPQAVRVFARREFAGRMGISAGRRHIRHARASSLVGGRIAGHPGRPGGIGLAAGARTERRRGNQRQYVRAHRPAQAHPPGTGHARPYLAPGPSHGWGCTPWK